MGTCTSGRSNTRVRCKRIRPARADAALQIEHTHSSLNARIEMNDNLVVGLPYYRMGHRSFLNDGTLGDTAVNSLPEQGGRRRSRYRLFDGSVQYEIRNRRDTVLLFVTGYESENAQRTRRSAQKIVRRFFIKHLIPKNPQMTSSGYPPRRSRLNYPSAGRKRLFPAPQRTTKTRRPAPDSAAGHFPIFLP